jgi:flagellin-like protein
MVSEGDDRHGPEWRGQSATIAVILLVAVTIILVAAVSVFVLGVFDNSGGDSEPVLVSIESELVGNEIVISHRSGNRLDPEEVSVRILGTTSTTSQLSDLDGAGGEESFEAGDRVTVPVDPTDPQFNSDFRVLVIHEPTNAVIHDKGYPGVTTAVFAFDSTSFPSDVDAGADATTTFTVNNTGDTADTVSVALTRDGGTVNSTSLSLTPGETATRTLSYTTTAADAPTTSLGLETGDDRVEATVGINAPEFTLTSTTFPDDVTAGDDSVVDFTVENTGSLAGSTTVELRRNGSAVNSTSLSSLSPGGTVSETLTYTTSGSDTPAINLTLDTGDDTADSVVNVTSSLTASTVYVGSDDGQLYAVNATDGSQEWAFSTGGAVESSPTVVDGTVYVGSNNNALYAVDAETGNQEWAFSNPSDAVKSSPTVVDGTVYVGSDDSTLYAVNATDGSQEWTFSTGGEVSSSPAVANGIAYVRSQSGEVFAVNATDGTEEWTFSTGVSLGIASSPTVAGGTVYIGGPLGDGTLYALDGTTGSTQWTVDLRNGVRQSSPTVESGTVYIGTINEEINAIDIASEDYDWNQSTADGVRSSPTVAGGTVYVGNNESSASGALFALDAGDGTEQWRFNDSQSAARIDSSPTVASGTVYVGSEGGRLYAVNATDGSEEWVFTNPSAAVSSSPTAVANPATGDSIGSRVTQETLGHHDE